MSDAMQWIQGLVKTHRVLVMVKPGCPFCTMAESALRQKGVQYHLEDITKRSDMQQAFQEMTGGRTVPRVWVNGQFIGGGTETERACRDGTIDRLLN